MKSIIKTILFAVIFFGFGSCKKGTTGTPADPPAKPGNLMLHLHTNVDSNEVSSYNVVYTMTGGRKILVTRAQLYISNIQLIKSDGSISDVTGLNILQRQQDEVYSIGNVPAGQYKSIRFNVGLSPTTNAATPASNDSTLHQLSMWFNTGSLQPQGYIFLNFQGKIDTSTAANNTVGQMQPFAYRIGTNARLKSVTMPDQTYTIEPTLTEYIHITIDYAKLLNGITLNNNGNLTIITDVDNAGSLSNQMANNIPLMFDYE